MVRGRGNQGRADQEKVARRAVGSPAAQPRPEDIARRAYELYEQRGADDGHDWEDWLEAERQLRELGTSEPPAGGRS